MGTSGLEIGFPPLALPDPELVRPISLMLAAGQTHILELSHQDTRCPKTHGHDQVLYLDENV